MKFSLKRGAKKADDAAPDVDDVPASEEKGEKEEKVAKKPKRAKSKAKGGGGGPKVFFAQHGEKLGLGLIVLVFGYLIYSGYSVTGMPDDRDPESLTKLVESARVAANEDMSAELLKDRRPELNYQTRVEISRQPTDATPYQPRQPWKPLPPSKKGKRTDPQLFKPVKVEVSGVFGAIAERKMPGAVDALAELPNAQPRKVEVAAAPKPKKPTRTRIPRGMSGEGGYSPYEIGDMGMDTGDPDATNSYNPYGEGDGSLLSGAGMGMGGPGMGVTRTLLGKYTTGWYKTGVSASSMSGSGEGMYSEGGSSPYPSSSGTPGAGGGVIARTRPFVVVKALFPLEKQAAEYEQVLQDAMGYQPMSDVPRIVFFEAQRADVTDDPDKALDETDWKPITDTNKQYEIQQKLWAGVATSTLDPKFVDPAITMPVPPVLMHQIDPIDLHSETPRLSRKPIEKPTDASVDPNKANPLDPLSELPTAEGPKGPMPMPVGPGAGTYPGAAGSYPGAAGSYPGASSSYPGMSGAYPGATSSYPGMSSSYPGMSGSGEGGYQPPGYGMNSYGQGGYGEGGYGEGGYGYGGPGQEVVFPEYKLVRFYDFYAQPGHEYRYRIRLWIEDPNRPRDPSVSPPHQMLDDATSVRVRKVELEDAKTPNQRTYWRTTDWSDASEPASVEVPEDVYVGTVTRPSEGPVKVAGKQDLVDVVRSPNDEVEGDLVATIWGGKWNPNALDSKADKYPTMIPGEHKVRRGTVLNFKTNAEVIHPLTNVIKQIDDYPFHTNAVVVDIRGGEVLPGEEKKESPLTAPGEFALIDDQGNFVVRNELDTIEGFRMYTFVDEKERATAAASPSPYGYPGGEGGSIPGYDEGYDAMMNGEGSSRPPRGRRSLRSGEP